jgi:hypothetical protein
MNSRSGQSSSVWRARRLNAVSGHAGLVGTAVPSLPDGGPEVYLEPDCGLSRGPYFGDKIDPIED